jgi:23S rRNA (cytosine1962-C5)-methyltransferase
MLLPRLSRKNVRVRLTRSAERIVRLEHPWLYAESLREAPEGDAGDLAVLYDHDREVFALGLFDPTSPIRVRVLWRGGSRSIDAAFFAERARAADALRAPLRSMRTTGYRVANGESDGLPGAVVDRYADTLVLKLYTAAWLPWLVELVPALAEALAPERIVLRLARSVATAFQAHGLADGSILHGAPLAGGVEFEELGLRFRIDPRAGQKTGFFLDQRENRARVGERARGRSVLDAFAYVGAFSLHAARGGASSLTSLDASAPALAALRESFALNDREPGEVVHGDAFEALARLAQAGRSFDLVVIDPPFLARRREELERALAAYARLAELALALVSPDGELVFASCSARVSSDELAEALRRGAARAGRRIEERLRTAHPLDPPARFPEAEYLKCIFARVHA